MDALLNWLWQGGMVAIAALGMLRLLDRAKASVRCLACWAALCVVAMLPLVPLVMAGWSPAHVTTASAAIVSVPSSWWTSGAILAAAWAIWSAAYAVRIAGAIVVVRRARVHARTFPAAVEPLLMHWQRVRLSGRPARLVLSDRVQAAAVLGCGRPMIAVAPTLISRLEAGELDRIVVHEWAHVQRRDDTAKLAQLIVRAIAGWHPAVWWLDRRLSIEQELACDEMVVAVSGGPKAYAACLVKIAGLRVAQRDTVLATGALSSAGLGRRVARLVSPRELASPAACRRTAALFVALLVGFAVGTPRVRFVETAVSTTVARMLHSPGQAAAATGNVASASPDDVPITDSRATGGSRGRALETTGNPARTGATGAVQSNARTERGFRTDAGGIRLQAEGPDASIEEPLPLAVAAETVAPGVEAGPPPLVSLPSPTPTAPPPLVNADSRSVWSPAADAGTAIGRKSREAGLATAGAFTQFAKKVAGSF